MGLGQSKTHRDQSTKTIEMRLISPCKHHTPLIFKDFSIGYLRAVADKTIQTINGKCARHHQRAAKPGAQWLAGTAKPAALGQLPRGRRLPQSVDDSPQSAGDSPHSATSSPHLSQELLSLAEHDLTDRQRAVLALIEAGTTGVALRELRQRLGHQAAEWEIKNDLALLKQCGLIVPEGRGRGACWRLKPLSFGELE